jgi:hypothetical protein
MKQVNSLKFVFVNQGFSLCDDDLGTGILLSITTVLEDYQYLVMCR